MINQLHYIIAEGTNPYENLALEEALFERVKEDECILYLWQNKQTVVIGKNQNCFKECKVNKLEQEGGKLARRRRNWNGIVYKTWNYQGCFHIL